jgi:uncharacterized RDD family membrane protein YckC
MLPKFEQAGPETPPPIKPENVLDSIFSESGPMPTARISLRALAFLLDFVLITAVASLIIWKMVLPNSHPGAFYELNAWSEELVEWFGNRDQATSSDLPQPSEKLAEALGVAREIQLLFFWFYFAIGEAFFSGSSLGKRICRIRSVSLITLGAPPALAGIVRGGLKAITLFWIFPVMLLATFIALFFNKRRQLGHDLLSRTAVVDEKYVNLQKRS